MSEAAGNRPLVTLSDGRVTLRPWSRDDARFMAEASADPAIQRYNGVHDRQGRPAPPLSHREAEAAIDQFVLSWRAFATTGAPGGVAFVITDARSGEPVGCCGVDHWTEEDVAQLGYWIAADARGRGYATRAVILLTRWLFVSRTAYGEVSAKRSGCGCSPSAGRTLLIGLTGGSTLPGSKLASAGPTSRRCPHNGKHRRPDAGRCAAQPHN